ncbi:MAG: hypothetical protein R3D66_03365 [Alphaproteobacteria bacterium]
MADDIQKIDRMAEPKRSEKLRKLQTKFTEDFWRDLLRYRELACALREYRKEDQPATCNDVHVNLGLKCSHLYNDLAHLCYLDGLLSKQPDLFDF